MRFHSAIKLFGLILILLTSFSAATAYADTFVCIETAYNTADCQSKYTALPEKSLFGSDGNRRKYWLGVIALIVWSLTLYWNKTSPNRTAEQIKNYNESITAYRLLFVYTIFVAPICLVLIRYFFE